MLSRLDTLLTGDRKARLDVAESTTWLAALESFHSEYDGPTAEYAVEALRQFLRVEEDEWVADRFVDSLGRMNDPPSALMLEALNGRSINVRWKALQWFVDRYDPAALESLESLWGRSTAPWEKAALIEALAQHGSTAFIAEFRDLVHGKQGPQIAAAAMHALAEMEDDEAVTALGIAAREGSRFLRVEAIAALESFPDSEVALQAILASTRDADVKIASPAVEALGRFDASSASARMMEVARQTSQAALRGPAVHALQFRDGPEVTAALVDALRGTFTEDEPGIAPIIQALWNRDDPAAVPLLSGMAPQSGDAGEEIGALVEYLSRDRDLHDGTRSYTTSCSFGDWDADDPAVYRPSPPRGMETIRCWASPGAPGSPETYMRLEKSMLIRVTDYFDDYGDVWLETDSRHSENCWVPMRLLERADPVVVNETGVSSNEILRVEFDMRVEDVVSGAAAALLDAGLLEIIEHGSEVVGVALIVEASDRDQVVLVGLLRGSENSMIGRRIDRLAHVLGGRYRDDPDLSRLLGWTVGEGETP